MALWISISPSRAYAKVVPRILISVSKRTTAARANASESGCPARWACFRRRLKPPRPKPDAGIVGPAHDEAHNFIQILGWRPPYRLPVGLGSWASFSNICPPHHRDTAFPPSQLLGANLPDSGCVLLSRVCSSAADDGIHAPRNRAGRTASINIHLCMSCYSRSCSQHQIMAWRVKTRR